MLEHERHFGTCLTKQPMRRTTSGTVFTEVQQGRDAVAARVMPVLGNAAIVLVVAGFALLTAAVALNGS